MSLTRAQRAMIFEGKAPGISGEGKCPFESGETVKLSSKVSLRVVAVLKKLPDRWTLRYEVQDKRDPVRNLRRTPGGSDFDEIRKSFDQHGYAPKLTEEEQRKAAQESAYTSAPSSLSDAGEAVDEVTQRRYSESARTKVSQQAAINQRRREHHELDQRLLRVREQARIQGVDLSSPERVIERQIVKMEKRLHEGKAA